MDVLIDVAVDDDASVEARAAAEWGLRRVSAIAVDRDVQAASAQAHVGLVVADIERFLDRRYEGGVRTDPLGPPPGTPIGSSRSTGGRR